MPVSYSSNASLPFPLPGSPSLLPNNLSLRKDGGALVFVRLNEAVYLSTTGRNDHHMIPAAAKSQVSQTAFAHVQGSDFLVITSSTGAYIWSADGSSMLYFLPLTDVIKGDVGFQFMRGIASNSSSVFLGTSLGHILEISIPNSTGEYGVELSTTVYVSSSPISCLFCDENHLLVGNDDGDVRCYQTYPRLSENPIVERVGVGFPCTAMVARGDSVIAGFSSGHIRGYSISSGDMVVEITAHARCITGLALHPYDNFVASSSEDQYICVWNFTDFTPRSAKTMELLCAEKLENKLCTGLCYFLDDRIGVTSYDEEEVTVLQRMP